MQDHLLQTQDSAIWVSASFHKLLFEKELGEGLLMWHTTSALPACIFKNSPNAIHQNTWATRSGPSVGGLIHPWHPHGLIKEALKGHKDDFPQSNKNISLVTDIWKHILLSAKVSKKLKKKGKSWGSSVKFFLGFHSPYLLPNRLDPLPHSPDLRILHQWRFSSY